MHDVVTLTPPRLRFPFFCTLLLAVARARPSRVFAERLVLNPVLDVTCVHTHWPVSLQRPCVFRVVERPCVLEDNAVCFQVPSCDTT